jgi:2-succinyl-5-enolpyruvyl-6-hydroxy-3-cyclohexene-1-carboxylate synthase
MNRYQPIYNIADLCSKKGLVNAVICPGSRCAPLTIAFVRHKDIQTKTFSDERSAGFIAIGMAQQSLTPTLLLCTSGTAAYNFSPAVAEAFFNQIPLIVFTADRPSEWIAQQDGQTIHQFEIFGRHVKKSFQLPQDYEHADSVWAIHRIVNEAINLSLQEPRGPVHINAPFREPLYPGKDEVIEFETPKIIEEQQPGFALSDAQQSSIVKEWLNYHKILIVAGQHDYDEALLNTLYDFFRIHNIPITGDIISNLHPLEKFVRHVDLFLGQATEDVKKSLQPDLLITFGKSVISKNIKQFLRKYKPKKHWHIQPSGTASDTYQSLTNIIHTTPQQFFTALCAISSQESFENQKQNNYNKLWEIEERRALRASEDFFQQKEFGELELLHDIIVNLPPSSNLHLANSMSVRYANFIGITASQKNIQVYSNRGTSGIDGCTSTAIGHALTSGKPNILITGDVAFFYDRNAFWHKYATPNLRVVLLNNHGGVIFKIIDGPDGLPEADEFFVTHQNLTAQKLCEEFDFSYLKLDSKRKTKNLLRDFFDFDGKTKILELETNPQFNKTVFDNFKQKIKSSYEHKI